MPIRNIISKATATKIKEAVVKAGEADNKVELQDWMEEFAEQETAEGEDLSDLPQDGIQPMDSDLNGEIDLDDQDEKMSDFLLCYFSLVTTPTDRQIHLLAASLGMKHEELERHIYSLLAEVVDETEADDVDEIIAAEDINDDDMEMVDP